MHFLVLNWENDIHVRSPSLLNRLDNGVGCSITQSISLEVASFISWVLRYMITPLHKDAFDKCRQSMRAWKSDRCNFYYDSLRALKIALI